MDILQPSLKDCYNIFIKVFILFFVSFKHIIIVIYLFLKTYRSFMSFRKLYRMLCLTVVQRLPCLEFLPRFHQQPPDLPGRSSSVQESSVTQYLGGQVPMSLIQLQDLILVRPPGQAQGRRLGMGREPRGCYSLKWSTGTEILKLSSKIQKLLVGLQLLLVYELCHEKTCFCHMWTTKAQMSLRIRTVLSAPLLFTAEIV